MAKGFPGSVSLRMFTATRLPSSLTHMVLAGTTLRTAARRSPRLFGALLSISICSPVARAQPARGHDADKGVDQIVTRELARQGLPGLQVAVGSNGRIVYSRAVGKADVENDVPLTPASLIRTGSIAKSISAVAAMTLVEAGKLNLDPPIQKFCSPFPT